MSRESFEVLAISKISDNKELVLSKNLKGEYVLATRAVINDNGRIKYYYDKGALIVNEEYTENFQVFIETIKESM